MFPVPAKEGSTQKGEQSSSRDVYPELSNSKTPSSTLVLCHCFIYILNWEDCGCRAFLMHEAPKVLTPVLALPLSKCVALDMVGNLHFICQTGMVSLPPRMFDEFGKPVSSEHGNWRKPVLQTVITPVWAQEAVVMVTCGITRVKEGIK